MALSTTQYGYIIDPMVPFTDGKGNTIKDGFVRVFVAGSSTPVITYRNFDGAANQDLIELDNSGRTKTSVIGSKGLTYKVCVYDQMHSQESPILTVDKLSVIGANITAGAGATVVTGLDGLTTKPDGFVDASVVGTDGYVALDHTLVTDDLDTDAKVTAVENDRYVPLLNDDVNDPDSKMTLGRLWQWVLGKIKSLSTTITAFRTGDVIPVDGPSGTAKMLAEKLLELTAQNALAGNIVKEFNPSEQTIKGLLYSYNGTIIRCKTTYTGPFDETKFFSTSGINGVGFATYGTADLPNDLNDCFENIVYACTDDEVGSSVLNKPDESNYFILYTIPTKVNAKLQYYVGMNNSNVIYMRSFWGQAGWSDWVEIGTDKLALHNVGPISTTTASTAPYNDLNTFPINEVAIAIASYSAIDHKPTNESFNVLTFGGNNGAKCQIVTTLSKKMYMRSCWSGSWSDWVEIGTDKLALHNVGPISTTTASTAPYNDLNTFPINEVAIAIASYSAIDHKPTNESFNVLTFGGNNGSKCQIASTNTNKMYMRSCWAGSWSEWVKISDTDESALHNVGGISATMAAAAPYNDLNTFPINEVAIAINSYSLIDHKPTNEPFNVMTFGGTNGGKCQIVTTNTSKMFIRSCWAGTWSEWVEIGKEEEDETFIDVLNQFDNIVCIGDSLTWSQVYTSATTSRQAKKTYPAVLGEIAHATAQVLANPGDKTMDAWNRWKDTFESKTNAIAIIFLGTNGGFTDTLSTDCPVGVDYTQWADTNTGCYGKIISKLKELGYKIILIQPFAVGQTSDLTITKKVVTDAGTRFGCAVVQSFRTTEDKYHYYPDGSGKNTLHYNDFGYSWFAYTLCTKVNNLDNDNLKLIIPS